MAEYMSTEITMEDRLVLCLASAGNTHNLAGLELHKKGYQLTTEYWHDREDPNDVSCHYKAEKDKRLFIGDGWLGVPGLVALWEIRGDDWKLGEGDYSALDQKAEKAIYKRFDGEGNELTPDW